MLRGLNHALNPDPTSELESEKDKIQVQRHNIGNVCREVSTKAAYVEKANPGKRTRTL